MTGAPVFAALALLDAAVLWSLVSARGRWQFKAGAATLILAFNFAVWGSLGSYLGWPTSSAPPAASVFVAGEVQEPDQATGDRGRIYLWLAPEHAGGSGLGYRSRQYEPRAYVLPYSEDLAKAVQRAQQIAAGGRPAEFSTRGHGRKGAHGRGGQGTPGGKYHAYELPEAGPPPKTPNQ